MTIVKKSVLSKMFAFCILFQGAAVVGPAFAQSATDSSLSAQTQTVRQERLALAQQLEALIAQGATSEQIAAWRQQNATILASQQQRIQALTAANAAKPMPTIITVTIPPGVTQEMADFLTSRADLANKYAQLHNQQLSAGGGDGAEENQQFQQQNAAEIQSQQQRSADLAAVSSAQPFSAPPPLVISPGTSAQMQAFLTLRDQLMREQIALYNQYLSATPAARAVAMAQWQRQNASVLHQLSQMSQNLSFGSSN